VKKPVKYADYLSKHMSAVLIVDIPIVIIKFTWTITCAGVPYPKTLWSKKMTNSTYLAMCSDKRIQKALKWEPKPFDLYAARHDPLGADRICTSVPYCSHNKDKLIWRPRTDDLVERLNQNGYWVVLHAPNTKHIQPWVEIGVNSKENSFAAPTRQESLLLAFAWTVGLKWEDNQWKERR
jgi:hypothetical protein